MAGQQYNPLPFSIFPLHPFPLPQPIYFLPTFSYLSFISLFYHRLFVNLTIVPSPLTLHTHIPFLHSSTSTIPILSRLQLVYCISTPFFIYQSFTFYLHYYTLYYYSLYYFLHYFALNLPSQPPFLHTLSRFFH